MTDGIIILGAGGHAKVVADIVLSCGEKLFGFLDDNEVGDVLGFPILGTLKDITKYQAKGSFVIGIGDNQTRKNIVERYALNWYTAIHPKAIIARDVIIGEGSVVMAGAVINPSARIGKHCIINTAAVVEHDNAIGDYAHISPNATLCGSVSIGALTHIGAGAVVKNNTAVCNDCKVGAGAAVVNDIIDSGTYAGVPSKRIQ